MARRPRNARASSANGWEPHIYQDGETLDQTCPACGLEQSRWDKNGGHGYYQEGETFCCVDCAGGIPCACAL